MPRKIPPDRFDEMVRCATEAFSAQGYRLTQMAGIADAVGVSKATLYLYVESKEALFALCLDHADQTGPIPQPAVLPVAAPAPGDLAHRVTSRIEKAARFPVLNQALARPRAGDIGAELRSVLDELYTLLETNCRVVRLVDRCSDHPEIGPIWQEIGRGRGRDDMARYVEMRVAAGQLRPLEHPRLAARIALETVATWAMHIKWDRAPEPYEPASTKAAVIEQICRGLISDRVLEDDGEVDP